MSEREHLVRFNLKDGIIIDMHREDGEVTLTSNNEGQVTLPNATGQQAVDLISLLEPLAESVEYPEESEA